MKLHQTISLITALAVAALVVTPAEAKHAKDKANSAYCASGKHVKDIKKCKENGGSK